MNNPVFTRDEVSKRLEQHTDSPSDCPGTELPLGGALGFGAAAEEAAEAATGPPATVPRVEEARALRLRARLELLADPRRSLRTLAEAEQLDGGLGTADDRRAQMVGELLTRCVALEAIEVCDVEATLRSNLTAGVGAAVERQLLLSWLLITGKTSRARRWLGLERRFARAEASESRSHQAELLEAEFQLSIGRRPAQQRLSVQEPAQQRLSVQEIESAATSGDWIRLFINCYWHVMDGELEATRRLCQTVGAIGSTLPPASRARAAAHGAAYHLLLAALEGTGEIETSPPGDELTLFSLAPTLIAAEAVAIGGTRECAAAWDAWFAERWPADVLRAPAWPALVPRVRALLACRAGDAAAGLRRMEQAIGVADRIDAPVEAAVARVQYAELLSFDPSPESRARWNEADRLGRERCRALAIPFEHHAHRAGIAATLGRFDVACQDALAAGVVTATPLTQREIEVLRLFKAGHSYRQAAALLDVGWRTVQSHAYNAYQKLGVSSKIAAISAASEQRLL